MISILVSGVLVNPFNRPLPNAIITLTSISNSFTVLTGANVTARTNDAGEYEFHLQPGNYAVYVAKESYRDFYGAITITATTPPTTLNVLLKQNAMEAELPPDLVEFFQQVQNQVVVVGNGADEAARIAAEKANAAAISEQNAGTYSGVAVQSASSAGESAATAEEIASKLGDLEQLIRDAGGIPVDSFEKGYTLTSIGQALRQESTGVFYSWRGSFPKVVPAGSTPHSTGGIGNTAWVDVNDLTLRGQITAADGQKLIGRCPDIAKLRKIEPTVSFQLIDVVSYSDSWAATLVGPFGGGDFVYDKTDVTSQDNGGSIIVTDNGARWKRRTEQLLPIHFGAEPGNKTDSTDALKRYILASNKRVVDFRGSYWTVSSTLDLTNVSGIISDTSGIFKVNPIDFIGDWVMTIGTPNTSAMTGRANRVIITGSLIIDCLNRTKELNGIFIKGQWFNVGHLRVSNFNGTGIRQEAVWDSTFNRVSVELCGNIKSYAYSQTGGGDTHNTTHITSLQVEQSYNKAIYMSGIRDVIDNIHCERTYITSIDDGTKNLPSGLSYQTCFFNMGSSIINQIIIDAATTATTPDGIPCVSTNPSVVLSMNYSTMNNIDAGGTIFSCNFGNQAEYNGVVAKDFYISDPAQKIMLRSPRIIGVLNLGSEITIENGIINKFTPRNNAFNILTSGGEITTIEYTANIRGLITFNNVKITNDIMDLRAPTGSGAATSVGSLYPPTVFNNCHINKVIGHFGSRAIFNGGYITAVALDSQCAFEFYNTKVGTFGYSGNRAFITRGVQADVVNAWSAPAHYVWPAGTITERVGTATAGTGVIYVSRDSTAVSWTPIVSV